VAIQTVNKIQIRDIFERSANPIFVEEFLSLLYAEALREAIGKEKYHETEENREEFSVIYEPVSDT